MYSKLSTNRSELTRRFVKRILFFVILAIVLFVTLKILNHSTENKAQELLKNMSGNFSDADTKIMIKEYILNMFSPFPIAAIVIAIAYIMVFYALPTKPRT
jgi:hypothetical protein